MNSMFIPETRTSEKWQGIPHALPWDAAYPRYRRLLFGALGQLAIRGYPAPPDDGIDLIHDFFLEAWENVASHFDPTKGRFETYLYGAFVNFARPRIIRLLRWRATLVAPGDMAQYESGEFSVGPSQDRLIDVATIRRAMSRLPTFEKALLAAYASDAGSTERDIAHRFSLSRHQLRTNLADALGQIAVYLGEFSGVPDRELSVIVALWRDKRSVKEASRLLGLPASEIQAMRARSYKRLVLAVKGDRQMSANSTKDSVDAIMQEDIGEVPIRLLCMAMSPESTVSDFEALRANANVIIDFLDSPASEDFFEKFSGQLTAVMLEKIYSHLGTDLDSDEDWSADLQPFLRAREEEERCIGDAFAQTLLPNLPDAMKLFAGRVFLGAPKIDSAEYEHLLQEISVIHGGEAAAELAEFGITPVTILEAAQAVANLARRFCRSNEIKKHSSLILDTADRADGYSLNSVLARKTAIREIVLMTQLPDATSQRLFDWIARVAQYVPHLFGGFEAALWGDELCLRYTDVTVDDLFSRWWTPPHQIAA